MLLLTLRRFVVALVLCVAAVLGLALPATAGPLPPANASYSQYCGPGGTAQGIQWYRSPNGTWAPRQLSIYNSPYRFTYRMELIADAAYTPRVVWQQTGQSNYVPVGGRFSAVKTFADGDEIGLVHAGSIPGFFVHAPWYDAYRVVIWDPATGSTMGICTLYPN